MKNVALKLRVAVGFIIIIVMNCGMVLASAPTRSSVETVAISGIELFFGALGGIAVVMGGIEFFQAFLAYRENEEEGGSGEANSKIGKKILAGIFCLIGAVLVFIILNWTKILFNLD